MVETVRNRVTQLYTENPQSCTEEDNLSLESPEGQETL
jgi:hypothetical protein